MSIDDTVAADEDKKRNSYHFDRHTPEYRLQFTKITEEMQSRCPMAWSDTYEGHWVAAGSKEVFELARCPAVSADHDIHGRICSEDCPHCKRAGKAYVQVLGEAGYQIVVAADD